MKLASRIAAAGVCFVTLTGCSSEPPPPTLAMATHNLVTDGEKLLASYLVQRVGRFRITEKAEKDSDTACVPGSKQRFFRAQGTFLNPERPDPGLAAGAAQGALLVMNYDKLVDNLDFWDNDLSVVVFHKPESAVTFMVAARITEPHILIVGKTDCIKPGE
ncbi:hypothetical protein Aple_048780 [Acrocarpospora pleiomorpha]|uniref:Lipoprotein n=1 Tax=Acrocarpospora pleiomorpha TaxID=90975 RepID=A0A5M3XQV2_9ACTN|nr:hypothetical protein [Acrocarpospora pleiomorpha]GES21981.1 hypothetical protein Aple_048780 [Acrocarpospora pleiomorpha]